MFADPSLVLITPVAKDIFNCERVWRRSGCLAVSLLMQRLRVQAQAASGRAPGVKPQDLNTKQNHILYKEQKGDPEDSHLSMTSSWLLP